MSSLGFGGGPVLVEDAFILNEVLVLYSFTVGAGTLQKHNKQYDMNNSVPKSEQHLIILICI